MESNMTSNAMTPDDYDDAHNHDNDTMTGVNANPVQQTGKPCKSHKFFKSAIPVEIVHNFIVASPWQVTCKLANSSSMLILKRPLTWRPS